MSQGPVEMNALRQADVQYNKSRDIAIDFGSGRKKWDQWIPYFDLF
jgi:hypothetical protein